MSLRIFSSLLFQAFVLTSFVLSTISISGAQVRTSPSYKLQSDSINFSGGLSTSTNYSMESTAGEVATGDSDSSTYRLRAGYQQMQAVFISMSGVADVVMTPSLGGLTGGTSNGSTSVSVLTDSPGGYQLTIQAEDSPAMQNGANFISDYVPVANPNPDMSFIVTATSSHFGFSPEGPDISQRFLDDGSFCNSSTGDLTLTCWDGLSTSETVIAVGGPNQPGGATTTINFRIGIGSDFAVSPGLYTATTTLTATAL
jgi:hypothetical protein